MSCYFQTNETDLWNPSNAAARLFIQQAHYQSELLGVPSGVGPVIEDECEINTEAFAAFVGASTREFDKTNHTIKRALMRGVTVTSLVLAERAGLLTFAALDEHWRQDAEELSRHMNRP